MCTRMKIVLVRAKKAILRHSTKSLPWAQCSCVRVYVESSSEGFLLLSSTDLVNFFVSVSADNLLQHLPFSTDEPRPSSLWVHHPADGVTNPFILLLTHRGQRPERVQEQ